MARSSTPGRITSVRASQCIGYDVTVDLADLPNPKDSWELHVSCGGFTADLEAAMSAPGLRGGETGVAIDVDDETLTAVIRAATLDEISSHKGDVPLPLTAQSEGAAGGAWVLHVRLPPRLESLAVFGAGDDVAAAFRGSILMSGKLEANAVFVDAPAAAAFRATRVRSESCTLQCGDGAQVLVADVLEAQRATISAGTVTLGKLLADAASVDAAGDLTVRAAYVRDLELSSRQGHVHVEGAHGSLRVEARGAGSSVRIGGLTGSAVVAAPEGTAQVHFDSIRGAGNRISAAGQCSVSLVAPAAVTVDARAASTVVVSPGLTGSFKADDVTAPSNAEPPPWIVRGMLTAWPSIGLREPEWHHDGKQPAGATQTRGGSGKVRVEDGVGVTGFYSPARTEGSSDAQALLTAAQPSQLQLLSSGGAVHCEVVSWQQAVRTRAQHRLGGRGDRDGGGGSAAPLASCEWCSDVSGSSQREEESLSVADSKSIASAATDSEQ